jgi:hypothetical protein
MNINKKTEYDQIKGMLKTMRILKESNVNSTKNLLREQIEGGDRIPSPELSGEKYDSVEVINKVEVKIISTDKTQVKIQEDEKKSISDLIDSFKNQVFQLTEFEPGFTIDDNQIRLDGTILDLELNFVFIAGEDGGLYINSEMLQIEEETIEMLEKLFEFVPTFNQVIEPILSRRLE